MDSETGRCERHLGWVLVWCHRCVQEERAAVLKARVVALEAERDALQARLATLVMMVDPGGAGESA